MLSSDFKKQVTNSLKNEYDITCHRMSDLPEYGESRRTILHCSCQGEKFTMMLFLYVDKGDYDGVVGSFRVLLPEMYTRKIESVNKKINIFLIDNSVKEVCKEMGQFLTPYHFSFLHFRIDLIKGLYIKNGKSFDIKKIESRIESDSYINFYTNQDGGQKCCDVKIINNEIVIKPERNFKDESIFKEPSTLVDGGMDVFKTNLAKSVIFYLSTRFGDEKRFDVDIEDYLPLTYGELKQQFLVYHMEMI
jgi:hypothetical protein